MWWRSSVPEEPYAPGKPGFGQWPATKFGWYGELGARGYPILAVHRGKNLMVAPEVAGLLDPVCRAAISRMSALDPDWRRLLDHLAEAGPSALTDLQLELGVKPKELKKLRSPLERCGAVVSRPLVYEEPHEHTSELARWDQVLPGPDPADRDPDPSEGLAALVLAGVHAAVVAPETELHRWFSWKWYWHRDLVDRLVGEGRLERPADGWVSCPAELA